MRERFARWIAWHLPRRVVYWAAIRLGATATLPPYGDQIVPDLRFMDALDRWTSAQEPQP